MEEKDKLIRYLIKTASEQHDIIKGKDYIIDELLAEKIQMKNQIERMRRGILQLQEFEKMEIIEKNKN